MERTFVGSMPARIARLPIDARGFPVPKFVRWFDGVPDFRASDQRYLGEAVNKRLCWICGQTLGRHLAFPIGPMCCVNRNTSEPPCHLDCATWAVQNCPFLSHPMARRDEKDLPEERFVAGTAISRNPGVVCIWVTRQYFIRRAWNNDGILFEPGEPERLFFYRESRPATRAEIDASIASGIGALLDADGRTPEAVRDIHTALDRFNGLLDQVVPRAA